MKQWAVLVHGKFDKKSDPNSPIEKMARDLEGAGYDVTTLNCDDLLPGSIVQGWQVGDEFTALGYSNGAPQIVNIIAELFRVSLIKVRLLILIDPVLKNMLEQSPLPWLHKDLVVPTDNIQQVLVYLRGHQSEYPNGRTRVSEKLTIVPMLTSDLMDHGRIIEVAAPEALALLQGGAIPDLSVPVPGQETVA